MTIEDALGEGFYDARERELQGRVGPKRFAHSQNVARTAAELARAYGLDERRARLAGILHDWDKGYDDAGILARAQAVDAAIDPELLEMPRLIHGMTAAAALGREHPGIPADVLQAVSRHTVGAAGMEPLDMVLYIADAIEPGRPGEEAQALRDAVGKASLRELFLATYAHLLCTMLERRKRIYSKTTEFWNSYMEEEGGYRAAAGADPMPSRGR